MSLEPGTHFEIVPEPTPEERAAIVAALDQLRAEEARGPGRWWEAGLRESVEEEESGQESQHSPGLGFR